MRFFPRVQAFGGKSSRELGLGSGAPLWGDQNIALIGCPVLVWIMLQFERSDLGWWIWELGVGFDWICTPQFRLCSVGSTRMISNR